MRIILASGSPRRKELLSLLTPDFEVIISGADETLKKRFNIGRTSNTFSLSKSKKCI